MGTVAGLAVYPPSLAATRLRIHQLAPALADRGFELRTWSFFDDREIAGWYGRSHLGRVAAVLRAVLRLPRLLTCVRGADVVVVQRELLPFGPPVLEMLVARGRRFVWDVDDSLWVSWSSPTVGRVPRWLRASGDKFSRLCERADEVWAGSEVLATWCRERNHNVHVVPTVVDVPPLARTGPGGRTLAWVGSHSTAEFVERVLPLVADLTPPVSVVVVGGEPVVPPALDCEIVPWSPEAERDALDRAAVGLYPIDRHHPLAEGKCGLKAVLFMSAGVPVVTTPTTTNATIVRNGVEGFHADSPEEWVAAIEKVLADEEGWRAMSRAAHGRALEDYSLQTWGPRIADRIARLVAA